MPAQHERLQLQNARAYPLLEPSVASLVGRVAIRQISPCGASTQHPEYSIENGTAILPRVTATVFAATGSGMSGSKIAHCESVRSRGWSVGMSYSTDRQTSTALVTEPIRYQGMPLGMRVCFLRSETDFSGQLKRARPARAEDLRGSAGGLPKGRAGQIAAIACEIRFVVQVEHLADQ